jgi:NAD(P)-dependent dehydrogenase (short-subunit alcohol dehydrogenase family)
MGTRSHASLADTTRGHSACILTGRDQSYWDASHKVGLRSHYVASCLVGEQMVKQKSGLIVNVSSVGGSRYLFNVRMHAWLSYPSLFMIWR